MPIKLVATDFDGTVTNVDEEAIPYVELCKQDIAENYLHIDMNDLEKQWSEKQKIIEQNPSKYGWRVNEKIVAPAYADPIILSRVIGDLFLNCIEMKEPKRNEILDSLFHKYYSEMGISFKNNASEYLDFIARKFDGRIITNSGTTNVLRKLERIDYNGKPPIGDAKKYIITDDWNEVSESIEKPGLKRPIYLRRKMYWDVIQQIMKETEIKPDEICVVGDIYELDLALPEQKEMRIILTPRPSTPQFEIDWVKSCPRGYIANNLEEVMSYLEKNE